MLNNTVSCYVEILVIKKTSTVFINVKCTDDENDGSSMHIKVS